MINFDFALLAVLNGIVNANRGNQTSLKKSLQEFVEVAFVHEYSQQIYSLKLAFVKIEPPGVGVGKCLNQLLYTSSKRFY